MFEEFNVDNLENAKQELEKIIYDNKKEIKELLKVGDKNYDNFVKPYQLLAEKLDVFLTPIFHIDSVKNSDLTQKVYSECLPLISLYETEISQDENVYSALKDIQYNYNSSLNVEQRRVLENEIRDFKLGGCGLDDEKKEELKNINLRLGELSKEFSQNLLDATNAYEMIVENYEDVKEIPKSDLELAAFTDNGKKKYKFTLQMPSYLAYITYGSNRNLREKIYKAYTTRAPQNEKLIDEILRLKEQQAQILGFDNYAQYSIAPKMAKSENEVIDFLYELGSKGMQKAKEELNEVAQLAKNDGIDKIQSFDMAYYSEKLKKARYEIDEEYYRQYFEQDSVLNGFFDFLNKLFGIKFKEVAAKVWDNKVKVYNLYEQNKPIARIYIDLEARSNKRGGAWMNNWHTHYTHKEQENLPTAYIVCNFPPSTKKTPSLLRHGDVVTLFHEMGHALHHLLSSVKEPFVSGINGVAWDVVEFPSQFLEYFAYQKDVLKMFAKHYESGEVLDDEAIEKLMTAKNFQSSLALMRQLEFAIFDFKLHQKLYQGKQVQSLLDSIRNEISPLIPPSYNKFQNGFSHIFAGGYAAGYYSYKWAEVLSADAFYLFLEKGIFYKELANKYKDLILGKGGSVSMDELFFKLTSRKPSIDSLLKIDGIIS